MVVGLRSVYWGVFCGRRRGWRHLVYYLEGGAEAAIVFRDAQRSVVLQMDADEAV